MVTLPKLPIVQIINAFNSDSLLKYCIILTMAVTAPVKRMPNISIVIISFTRVDTYSTSNNTMNEPAQATSARGQDPEKLKMPAARRGEKPITKIATPRLAPALIPNTYGPAKGLRKTVCICNPLNDKAAPVNIAVKAFGNRNSKTIV
jgi:hypothetical protein